MSTWDELNDRQRAYLRALYDGDQAEEQYRRQQAARGAWDHTPASTWRWQMYGPTEPPAWLYTTLVRAGLVDQGTGATWQALEDRGLCDCETIDGLFGSRLLRLQITPAGRRAVRAATGWQAPKRMAKGQLRERQWAALVRLHGAGNAGIGSDDLLYSKGGFDWYATIGRLVDLQLVAYRTVGTTDGVYHLTDAGRAYYARERERYRDLYPAIEAPEP